MAALIFKFLYGFAKSSLEFTYLAEDQLGKTQKDRCVDTTFAQIVDDLLNVSRQVLIFRRMHDEIAFSVDAKIIGSPIIDSVSFDALIYYCGQFVPLPDVI